MNQGTPKTVNPSICGQRCRQRETLSAEFFKKNRCLLSTSFRSSIIVTFLCLLLLAPLDAKAFDLSYGGRLTGPAGEPVAGPLDLTFRFFREASGGTALVIISVPNVTLVDGVFHTPVPISAEEADRLFEDGDQTVFVEVESQGKVYPRQKFSYVPLALRVPVDGTKIVYDSQGRLTLGTGTTTGTFPGISGIGGVEKTGDQSYSTYPLSAAGKSLMGAATPAAQRTALGLGTMAERNSITPSDLSSATCADGTVLRQGPSGWGCETLSPSNLSSLVSQTEFDYLDGVTSPIQTQINSRLSSAGGTMSGPLTLSQGSELRLATSNAGVSAGFKAPANLPTSTIYTLPSGLPGNGQMLTSSSSGLLSWTTIPVTSVNGQIGSVSLNADNIDETGNRKYFSQALARQSISTTGLLSYNPATGVMSLSDTLLTKSGGTMTGSLDFAGTLKVTNLADPTADGDAAKKAYVDGKLGGQPLVVGTPSPGQVIKWDGSKFALASDELGQPGGGIASLNTLTSGSQSLAVDIPGVSAGTRPNWTADTATSTHRLTIPMASASGVTAGLISKTDYDVFSSKQDGITPSSTVALGSMSTNWQNAIDLKPYGTNTGQTGEMRFRELAASGTNYLGLKPPDNLLTNTVWTLPSGDGTSGFVLSTDGSGTLSWISPTTGSVTSIATGTGLAGGLISGTGTISLANVGTAGTYTKVTTNAQGQVISGSNLADTDIPNLSATKITSGTLAVDRGGTGAATAQPFFVLAGPGVGPTAGAPSFRTLVAADIPSLDASKITSGTLANSLINWAAAPVTTVAGRTGAVALSDTDIAGLGSLATANAVSGGSGGTIADDSITNADISSNAAIADTKLATIATSGKVANSATTATSAGTANAIVARDASGNFTAGTITATLNGNATNVTGTVALSNGGTGATTADGARINLGAAASGANTDITSLTNLTSLSTTGNVGIGTTAPSSSLQIGVQNATSTSSPITLSLGGTYSSTPGTNMKLKIYDDGSTSNLYGFGVSSGQLEYLVPGTYRHAWFVGDSEKMRMDGNGNVGIGMTAPVGKLDVVGKIASISSSGALWDHVAIWADGGNGYIDSGNGNSLRFRINSVTSDAHNTAAYNDVMTLINNGNVGFGVTSPSAKIHVYESSAGNSSMLVLERNVDGFGGGDDGAAIEFRTRWSGNGATYLQMRIRGVDDNISGYGSGAGGIAFDSNFNFTYQERLRIQSNGNVGVGTTAPAALLDVSGNILTNSTLGWSSVQATAPTVSTYITAPASNSLAIATNSTERIRIDAAGNVGLGTSNPVSRLEVNGGVKLANDSASCTAANAGTIRFDGTNYLVCRSNAWFVLGSNSSSATSFGCTGANQSYTVPSGITSVAIKMWGAGGGGGSLGGWAAGYPGGAGGFTAGNLAVTPGQVLTVIVGCGGRPGNATTTTGAYGGGARGCNTGTDCRYGGGGGGRSAIRNSTGTELMTAGGGGGGGSSRTWTYTQDGGAGGGLKGQDGAPGEVLYGKGLGGAQSYGGWGGQASQNGSAGTQFTGGTPASHSYGGGGGGGWYGGGGGSYQESNTMGGGGGGSGYIGGSGVTEATTIGGWGTTPPETRDFHYVQGVATGGQGHSSPTWGGDGRVVIIPN